MKKTERSKFFKEMAERMKAAAIKSSEAGNAPDSITFCKLASLCADKASGVRKT